MGVKLFVGGLSFTTSNDSLRDAFARHGIVQSAMVMTDRETQRSRGFGFVEMSTQEEADRAIAGMNGANLDGRMIRVDKATPRGSSPSPRPARPMGASRPGGPPGAGGGRPWTPRPPGSGPGGGGGGGGGGFGGGPPRFGEPPKGGDTRGGGRGAKRRDEGERRPGGPKRSKPPGERRTQDKGRRNEDFRW